MQSPLVAPPVDDTGFLNRILSMTTLATTSQNLANTSISDHAAQHGFTMIELMVVVAIVAVLAALAAPSFTPLIERWRVRDAADNLQSTIYFARSESIKRGGSVVIAKNPNSGNCTTASTDTEWGCGWRVFFDANGDGVQAACVVLNNPNECTIQTSAAPTSLAVNLPGSNGLITLDRWGTLSNNGNVAGMAFDVFPKDGDLTKAAAARLCVAQGGRVKRIKGSESC